VLLLCSRITGNELTFYDSMFSKLIFVIVLIEFFADQQQWNFHGAKDAYKQTAKVPKEYNFTREQLDRGFNTSGLWAWSRHPNFAAEQGVWLALYQWSCSESETYVNWCFAAALSYLILFQASTWLTELISAKKYPDYKLYQQRVGRFLPKVATGSMDTPAVNGNAVDQKQKEAPKAVKATGTTKRR
jgi:steroid 5-alpha reductase family enzyme